AMTVAAEENAAEADPEPMGDTSTAPAPNTGADQGAVEGTADVAEIVAETAVVDGPAHTSTPDVSAETAGDRCTAGEATGA
ncbi:MAG: hypothetical protein Q4P32_03315, partial [Micrococcales bacterium]|nr:hypothetical protein [Micrococcales bacterium]